MGERFYVNTDLAAVLPLKLQAAIEARGVSIEGVAFDGANGRVGVDPAAASFSAAEMDIVTEEVAAHDPVDQDAMDAAADKQAVSADRVEAGLTQLEADLLSIPGANTAALKDILARTLQRQRAIIKALRRLV